jgi:hypothetical protein
MKRMLNGFKRYGITCPRKRAASRIGSFKLIRCLVDGRL